MNFLFSSLHPNAPNRCIFGYLVAAFCALLICSRPLRAAEPITPEVDFARDVYAIFERSCLECHGPHRQEGELRLDVRESALAGGASGAVIVPGKPDDSELLRRITLPEGHDDIMPARGKPLLRGQIEMLRAWIAAGAVWPDELPRVPHWSYVPPLRPASPQVAETAWPRNPIDQFVLARLERERLSHSPEADRAALLRRLSLDLVGLPPSPDEVEAFVADTSDGAYEKLVDRLLASPQFGERWARPWLDAARYADSHGFQRDDLRELWAYRDWVIQALNDGLPFDRFTLEQIAGDLLPGAGESQRIATGFHRSTTTNVEAGSDPEETRINQVIDRLNTTATVWLGTTLECAQCHDHKYDPFTQRDYYGLLAFFNNTEIEADRSDPKVPSSIRFLGPSLEVGEALPEMKRPTSLIMRELCEPRATNVFLRGDFRTPGEPVQANVPRALHPLPEGPRNRLALARWLVDRNNPLTARVVVNRWWAELFGHGIVATVEDFGVKGEPPTHRELLDWLAVEFMENGWSMKRILRTMVTSATYRQSSRATAELLARDDRNLLYARGPRFRLDAEAIRDNALAISGLLCLRRGGPPIRPYQPDGLWKKVGGQPLEYVVSPGGERYRRGIYIVWKRASPYPSFVNFDATARLTCTVKRSRSNTPLQALTLLNDPVYVEAAFALAERVMSERLDASLDEQLRFAFRVCVARGPDNVELGILRQLHAAQLAAARADPAAAKTLAEQAERRNIQEVDRLVAWYAVAAALLNLDETITKN